MKNITRVLSIVLTLFISMQSIAQNAKQGLSGLYLTAADYADHKLSFAGDCTTTKNRIKLHDWIYNGEHFTIVYNGAKQSFKKADVFGFADCSGRCFRFYQSASYRIVDTGGIYIYVQEEYVSQYKANNKTMYHYYFSKAEGSEIMALTADNVRMSYSDNPKFLAMLELYFQTGNLAQYDFEHNKYKLNYLLGLSLK